MKFVSNEGKKVEIEVDDEVYLRHAIRTKFVSTNDNYLDIIKKYVKPLYKEGDIVSISEKIISICQNRVIKREDIKVGLVAKVLSRFASHPDCGVGVGESIKMQYAINTAGLFKVICASILGGITKLFGIKGVFYKIVGQEVSGLDGFYDHVWDEYRDIGIPLPRNPIDVCNEIKNETGVSSMIVDANDLGQVILGKSEDIKIEDKKLKLMIRDNPAGQGREQTPLVLIRKKENDNVHFYLKK